MHVFLTYLTLETMDAAMYVCMIIPQGRRFLGHFWRAYLTGSRHRHIKLILELSHFKQLNLAAVSTQYQSVLGYPGLTQVVGWLHLHDTKLLQIALTVTKQLEELLPHHTQLSVVLRIEGYLWRRWKTMK